MQQLTAVIRPDTAPVHYFRGGAGEPLLYLHHLAGMQGWEPALSELSTKFDVIAPYHPGFGPSEGLDEVDNGLDLVLHYIGQRRERPAPCLGVHGGQRYHGA